MLWYPERNFRLSFWKNSWAMRCFIDVINFKSAEIHCQCNILKQKDLTCQKNNANQKETILKKNLCFLVNSFVLQSWVFDKISFLSEKICIARVLQTPLEKIEKLIYAKYMQTLQKVYVLQSMWWQSFSCNKARLLVQLKNFAMVKFYLANKAIFCKELFTSCKIIGWKLISFLRLNTTKIVYAVNIKFVKLKFKQKTVITRKHYQIVYAICDKLSNSSLKEKTSKSKLRRCRDQTLPNCVPTQRQVCQISQKKEAFQVKSQIN